MGRDEVRLTAFNLPISNLIKFHQVSWEIKYAEQ